MNESKLNNDSDSDAEEDRSNDENLSSAKPDATEPTGFNLPLALHSTTICTLAVYYAVALYFRTATKSSVNHL